MFPPVDDQVLGDNPGFAKLYSLLTTVILNPDGTTKHDAEATQRAAVREELDAHRLAAAKNHLLEHAIATAVPPEPRPLAQPAQRRREPSTASPELPEPLMDVLLALPPLLRADASLPAESVDLVLSSPPLSELGSLMPQLAALVSSNLHSSALNLVRLTHPTTNASYLHRHISALPKDHAALLDRLSAAQQELAAARARTLTSLAGVLGSYTRCLDRLVQALEAKHGVVARSLELRATDAALQAQRVEGDARSALCSLGKALYPPEAVAALQSYVAHLADAKDRVAERVRGLEAELAEYGVGTSEAKEKMMREMARAHGDLTRQLDEVKRDLGRLQHE